jgi:Ni,Fe-hydrogenase III small subunit/NAD-dependent dihydropyrimidine dehydrogenase PreA subunit
MIKVLLARMRQRHRTIPYPAGPAPELPPRFAGRPRLDGSRCPQGCRACAGVCPVGALRAGTGAPPALRLDLGACLFCRGCAGACPYGAISFGREYRLAAARREDLVLESDAAGPPSAEQPPGTRRLFGRSFRLRQVSAGGCNACEADVNVLSTIGWDLGRFGVQFVASPRHADGLLVTGPVTVNMRLALEKTWRAVPEPRVVIALGACAISGGPYRGHPEAHDGAASTVPVDLFIPGCPPHPLTILEGLLRFLGRIRG